MSRSGTNTRPKMPKVPGEGAYTKLRLLAFREVAPERPSPIRGTVDYAELPVSDRWWERGLCRPGGRYSDLPWVSLDGVDQNVVRFMVAVCDMCPVRGQCAADAAEFNDRQGVRAGVAWTNQKQLSNRNRFISGENRNCQRCGEVFQIRQSGRRLYCSPRCYDEEQRLKARARDAQRRARCDS